MVSKEPAATRPALAWRLAEIGVMAEIGVRSNITTLI